MRLGGRRKAPDATDGVAMEGMIIGTELTTVPPNAVKVRCSMTGCDTETWLGVDQVRDYGRWPTAVVLCSSCGALLLHEHLKKDPVAKDLHVTDVWEFDPPEAGDLVEKTRRPGPGLALLYEWTNDTAHPVTVIRKADPTDVVLLAPNDVIRLTLNVELPVVELKSVSTGQRVSLDVTPPQLQVLRRGR